MSGLDNYNYFLEQENNRIGKIKKCLDRNRVYANNINIDDLNNIQKIFEVFYELYNGYNNCCGINSSCLAEYYQLTHDYIIKGVPENTINNCLETLVIALNKKIISTKLKPIIYSLNNIISENEKKYVESIFEWFKRFNNRLSEFRNDKSEIKKNHETFNQESTTINDLEKLIKTFKVIDDYNFNNINDIDEKKEEPINTNEPNLIINGVSIIVLVLFVIVLMIFIFIQSIRPYNIPAIFTPQNINSIKNNEIYNISFGVLSIVCFVCIFVFYYKDRLSNNYLHFAKMGGAILLFFCVYYIATKSIISYNKRKIIFKQIRGQSNIYQNRIINHEQLNSIIFDNDLIIKPYTSLLSKYNVNFLSKDDVINGGIKLDKVFINNKNDLYQLRLY